MAARRPLRASGGGGVSLQHRSMFHKAMNLLSSEVQRGPPLSVQVVQVGAGLRQQLHRTFLPLQTRPAQGAGPSPCGSVSPALPPLRRNAHTSILPLPAAALSTGRGCSGSRLLSCLCFPSHSFSAVVLLWVSGNLCSPILAQQDGDDFCMALQPSVDQRTLSALTMSVCPAAAARQRGVMPLSRSTIFEQQSDHLHVPEVSVDGQDGRMSNHLGTPGHASAT
ncbi:hypothetical protein F7725_026477 [Dissostichus mawsoni]|uniref:Uncharacterized protein n=1 Tax=Dissostichus mawsoni TaxID=36200 RepID=A0A7J5X769_DISMA|nr:hypothetical protein F7725_026477 [Dissostichus mawsoni]